MNKPITCDDAVRALKQIGKSSPAKHIAFALETDSRAVATAMRSAVADGRVSVAFKRGIGHYRFKRMQPVKLGGTLSE